MSAHTKGPWWVAEYGIRNASGYICAIVRPTKYPGQDERYATEKSEREGDEHLIAAAPRLLKALERVVQADDNAELSQDDIEFARAAIKAAKGEA